MITRFKVTCPTCGDSEIKPTELKIIWWGSRSDKSFYFFHCVKDCKELVRKPLDEEVRRLLHSGGVKEERPPAEMLEEHLGAVFNYDDILDFYLTLENDDRTAELLSEIARGV